MVIVSKLFSLFSRSSSELAPLKSNLEERSSSFSCRLSGERDIDDNVRPMLVCKAETEERLVFPYNNTQQNPIGDDTYHYCEPIFYGGQPSLSCKGKSTTLIRTFVFQPPPPVEDGLTGLAMLIYYGFYLWKWFKKKKTIEQEDEDERISLSESEDEGLSLSESESEDEGLSLSESESEDEGLSLSENKKRKILSENKKTCRKLERILEKKGFSLSESEVKKHFELCEEMCRILKKILEGLSLSEGSKIKELLARWEKMHRKLANILKEIESKNILSTSSSLRFSSNTTKRPFKKTPSSKESSPAPAISIRRPRPS